MIKKHKLTNYLLNAGIAVSLAILSYLAYTTFFQESSESIALKKVYADLLEIDGLDTWQKDIIKINSSYDHYLFIYYNQLCGTCKHTRMLSGIQELSSEKTLVTIMLHPSHSEDDVDNIRTNLDIYIPISIADPKLSLPWDSKKQHYNFTGVAFLTDSSGKIQQQYHLSSSDFNIDKIKHLF